MNLVIVDIVIIFLVEPRGLSVQWEQTQPFEFCCKGTGEVWAVPVWTATLTLLFHTCRQFKCDPGNVHPPAPKSAITTFELEVKIWFTIILSAK